MIRLKKLHVFLIAAIVVIIMLNTYFSTNFKENASIYFPGYHDNIKKTQEPVTKENVIKISTGCKNNFDCSWTITNCCSENAGGHWECISKGSQIECNDYTLCPQVLSPKPKNSCSCVEGSCVAR